MGMSTPIRPHAPKLINVNDDVYPVPRHKLDMQYDPYGNLISRRRIIDDGKVKP